MSDKNDVNASLFAGVPGAREAFGLEEVTCGCWTCISEIKAKQPLPYRLSFPFIVCPTCGNKRCPKATHHDNECTHSNDTCQPGSRYGGLPGEGGPNEG